VYGRAEFGSRGNRSAAAAVLVPVNVHEPDPASASAAATGPRARRPAIAIAALLACGQALGLAAGAAGAGAAGAAAAGAAAGGAAAGGAAALERVLVAVAAAGLAVASVAAVRGARANRLALARRRGPRAAGPWLAVALVALAAVPSVRDAAARPRADPATPAPPPNAPLEGQWRALRGRGDVGRLVTSQGALPWRLRVEGPAPPDGARVRVLPPINARAFARGPAPGPAARAGEFAGEIPLEPDQIAIVGLPTGSPTEGPLDRWRAILVERVQGSMPAAPGLAAALLVGDRESLDPALAETFRRTGTSHMLALSGLHVGVVAVLVLRPLVRVAGRVLPGGGALALGLALLGLYVALAGAHAPIVRAGLALALAWIAVRTAGPAPRWVRRGEPGRRIDGLSLWSVALAFELVRSPAAIEDPGTQLSFGATLAILCAARPIADGIFPPRGDRDVARVMLWTRTGAAIRLRVAAARILRLCALAIGVSLAATLATAPIVWTTFGEFSPWSAPASALAGPLLLPMLGGLWADAAFGHGPWSDLSDGSAALLVAILEAFDRLPASPWLAPQRPAALLAAAALVGLGTAALAPRIAPVRAQWGAGCAFALSGAVLLPWSAHPARLEVFALDVGHGTAVLVRAPGLAPILFDAGSRDRPGLAREALGPLLAKLEPARLWVVLSHPDRDHWLALPWLAERLPPERWIGPDPVALGVFLPAGVSREDLAPGRLELVAPGAGPTAAAVLRGSPREDNEGSRHLLLSAGDSRVLLLGDAVGAGLASLLDGGHLPPAVDLMLVPHHGSFGRHAATLLRAVDADRLWVSVEREPPLAEELDRRRASWAWTGRDGPLVWRAPPSGSAPILWSDRPVTTNFRAERD